MRRLKSAFVTLSLSVAAVSPVAAQEIPIDKAEMMQKVMKATNAYRASQGINPVSVNTTLSKVAMQYVNLLGQTNKSGHNADGLDSGQRVGKTRYKACKTGENYASISNSPNIMPLDQAAAQVVKNWIASPGHEKNMRDPDFKHFGFGVIAWQDGNKKTYKFIQLFANDCGAMDKPPGPVSFGRPKV